jgi:hypothetical protein
LLTLEQKIDALNFVRSGAGVCPLAKIFGVHKAVLSRWQQKEESFFLVRILLKTGDKKGQEIIILSIKGCN